MQKLMLAENSSDSELFSRGSLESVFGYFDLDGSGSLESEEFKEICVKQGGISDLFVGRLRQADDEVATQRQSRRHSALRRARLALFNPIQHQTKEPGPISKLDGASRVFSEEQLHKLKESRRQRQAKEAKARTDLTQMNLPDCMKIVSGNGVVGRRRL